MNKKTTKVINIKDRKEATGEFSDKIRKALNQIDIIGSCDAIQLIMETIVQIADTDVNILISGESGTGKELFARLAHLLSTRGEENFEAVNCGAIAEGLVESELFGHVKGAFTGANVAKKGRFELANNGTLFLDEVAELPLSHQVKLLRVLDDNHFRPVGAQKDIVSNVRVITASNRDLYEMVKKNKFREDLYYRLKVVSIVLPPLRERRYDILALISYFLDKNKKKFNRISKLLNFSNNALEKLQKYHWPGNIRQLSNVVESQVVTAGDKTVINVEDLPMEIIGVNGKAKRSQIVIDSILDEGDTKKLILLNALIEAGGVQSKAAGLMGISRRTMSYRVKKLKINPQKDDLKVMRIEILEKTRDICKEFSVHKDSNEIEELKKQLADSQANEVNVKTKFDELKKTSAKIEGSLLK